MIARILLAATPDAVTAMERVFQGHPHDFVVANTLAKSIELLRGSHFDLVLIGVHFDQSRMFDLLRVVRTEPEDSKPPVICFCTRDTPLSRTLHETIDVTTRAMGAWMYLDQHKFNVVREPQPEMLRLIERCLTGGSRKKTQAGRLKIDKQRSELLRLRQALDEDEWSVHLENRAAELRHQLSVILQELAGMQSDSLAQQADTALSDKCEDRVSPSVAQDEHEMDAGERRIGRHESELLAQEEKIVPLEEAREREGRQRLASDAVGRDESSPSPMPKLPRRPAALIASDHL